MSRHRGRDKPLLKPIRCSFFFFIDAWSKCPDESSSGSNTQLLRPRLAPPSEALLKYLLRRPLSLSEPLLDAASAVTGSASAAPAPLCIPGSDAPLQGHRFVSHWHPWSPGEEQIYFPVFEVIQYRLETGAGASLY